MGDRVGAGIEVLPDRHVSTDRPTMVEQLQAEIERLLELAYAPDGREHRSMMFEEAAKRLPLQAEIERLRTALDVIAGFGTVPLTQEWPAGLRDIIRAMADCAKAALSYEQPTREEDAT